MRTARPKPQKGPYWDGKLKRPKKITPEWERKRVHKNWDWTDKFRQDCWRADYRGGTLYQRVNDGPYWFDTSAKRQGAYCPDWRVKIAHGQDATTSLVAGRKVYQPKRAVNWFWEKSPTYPTGRKMIYEPGYTTVLWAIVNANRPSLPVDETTANNIALRKIYQKIRASRTSVQGLTMLGELGKTIEGIKNPGRAMRDLLAGHVQRCGKASRKYSKPGDVAKAWAGSWLEFNYGWVPLWNDVAGSVDALFEVARNHFPNTRLTASGADEKAYEASGVHQNTWRWSDSCLNKVIVKYTVGLNQFVPGASSGVAGYAAQSLKDRMGLRLDEFLPTVWELVPWSFMVDYFTNFGDLVDAFSMSKEQIVYCNKTVVKFDWQDVASSLAGDIIAKADATRTEFAYGSSEERIFTANRSVTRGPSVLGLPSFQFTVPSKHQWTNIGALITQAAGITGKEQRLRPSKKNAGKLYDIGLGLRDSGK